ncbi:N-acetylmuramoyl-L-alanine amidase [Granulosicoccus antarcticus]|uniref:N-acetylmuramoyl-L-alanine amidase n=1 Tax=Granulosicoccus antarcticus IMCC3135 TaxID=1192854 RepID=A0A2Z2NPQ3_9GAMM|nr:N-acetylmuramoyl-L-alanine amidase [Granulosicoccus antarcticus]ASJ72445.1 N-acetylmuramoyl-L-alanine amidase AmiC [Granulosicoccus antarcticus IMCC3135]
MLTIRAARNIRQWVRQAVCPLILLVAGVLGGFSGSLQAAVKLNGFNLVQQENVMLHFDLDSANATADVFSLSNPNRLVVDLPEATLATPMPTTTFSEGIVSRVRYAQHGSDYLRVVLDLRGAVNPTYELIPRQGGKRLLINLGVKGTPQLGVKDIPEITGPVENVIEQPALRNAVVAIDAGHGGRDPGAVGQKKTLEKDITLAVAQKLYKRLEARPGVTPILIRDSDVYIELRERMNIARNNDADLFVSIHADAINHNQAKGSSVYTLSLDGASSEAAAWLAKSENEAAALYGDIALDQFENSLRQTLLNLTQSATMESSMEAGADVLSELTQVGAVHKSSVEQAAFAVLKSPDIPSILVETAFISNLQEEKKLKSSSYQDDLARAIESGVIRYLGRRAPAGTYLAAERRKRGS